MKLVHAVSVLALSTFVFTACDEDLTGIEIADLAGFWNATQFEYEDDTGDNPGFGVDAITDADGSVTLDVETNGDFTGTINIPGLTPQTLPIGGTISLNSDTELHIDFNETTESYNLFGDFDASFTLVNDVLTFVNDATTFDFPDQLEQCCTQSGQARGRVPATLTATFER